jgi:hypothetical protein
MKNQFKKLIKKIWYYTLLLDGLWSVPLGFFVFFFVGMSLSYFGLAAGSYDVAFIQPLFLAGTIVVGATNMAMAGMYFTFRTIYRYLYGKEDKTTGVVENKSKLEFKASHPIFKICVSLFIFCFFVVAILSVYLRLV